jgi:hypothetical protein
MKHSLACDHRGFALEESADAIDPVVLDITSLGCGFVRRRGDSRETHSANMHRGLAVLRRAAAGRATLLKTLRRGVGTMRGGAGTCAVPLALCAVALTLCAVAPIFRGAPLLRRRAAPGLRSTAWHKGRAPILARAGARSTCAASRRAFNVEVPTESVHSFESKSPGHSMRSTAQGGRAAFRTFRAARGSRGGTRVVVRESLRRRREALPNSREAHLKASDALREPRAPFREARGGFTKPREALPKTLAAPHLVGAARPPIQAGRTIPRH